jgi:hypothetical protein
VTVDFGQCHRNSPAMLEVGLDELQNPETVTEDGDTIIG